MRQIRRGERHDESDESMVTVHMGCHRSAVSPMVSLVLNGAASRRSADVRLAASEQPHSVGTRVLPPPPRIFPLT